jgi:hypothetical protein
MIAEHCRHCQTIRKKIIGDVNKPSRNHGWEYEEWYQMGG